MQVEKTTGEYTIFKKRNARFAIKDKDNKYVNGEEKTRILLAEGLIKVSEANPNAAKEADAAAAEDSAEDAAEA